MSFINKTTAILWKDIRSEFRTKEMVSTMLIFSLLVVIVFGFAFDPAREDVKRLFPGILWITFFFAGLLGLNRSFVNERNNDSLHGLMLCPVDRSAIYFAKVLGNLLFMLVVQLISTPLFFVLLDYPWSGSIGMLLLSIFLSTFGFVGVGTFLAALAANTRASEVLLPIILFPLVVPVVIAAVKTTGGILLQGTWEDVAIWFKVLAVYDIIFLAVPFLLFDYLLEV